jgi:Icc-related predicted phosphoesterase
LVIILFVSFSFFVSDLHGETARYRKLLEAIRREKPDAVFIGGDILPHGWGVPVSADPAPQDFLNEFLVRNLRALRQALGKDYPRIFLIMGNDDARADEAAVLEAAGLGIWDYMHERKAGFGPFTVYGYAYVPPTPFRLKDWEKYDVSRYIDPNAVSPEEGWRTYPVPEDEKKYSTISADLDRLTENQDLTMAIFLFHAPPYRTRLDLSDQRNRKIDHVPLDNNLGSIAIRRFIEGRQPLLTLHGHIHESARLSGSWRDRIGRTHCFSAAHDGPELALIRFDPAIPEAASRELI